MSLAVDKFGAFANAYPLSQQTCPKKSEQNAQYLNSTGKIRGS
jgi:hypothetical protein